MKLYLTIVLFISSLGFFAQDEEKKFIQLIIPNLETREQSVSFDKFVRSQEGVYMSRTDLNSKKYLLIYYSNSTIDLEQLKSWLEDHSLQYKCEREGIHGKHPILNLKPECE